jgi:hypothetical protein
MEQYSTSGISLRASRNDFHICGCMVTNNARRYRVHQAGIDAGTEPRDDPGAGEQLDTVVSTPKREVHSVRAYCHGNAAVLPQLAEV